MNNHQLLNIIEEIKRREDVDLTEIAAAIDRNRSALSKFINAEKEKPVTKALLRKFKSRYPAYFPESNINNAAHNNEILRDPVAILTKWRQDAEAKYQDSNKRELALIAIINDYVKAIPNLIQGQKNIQKQLLHSTENLGRLIARHRADLVQNPALKKGTGLGRRKPQGDDGERKGH